MLTRVFPPGAAGAEVTITVPPQSSQIVSINSTTASNTTLTNTIGAFTAALVGLAVSGVGIPSGTTVASVQSPYSLTLNQAASDSTTNIRNFGGTVLSCVKNGTTTVTSSALFASVFPGMLVTGPGITAGTTVAAVASASSLTLSAAAGDSNTNTLTFSYPRSHWKLKALKMRLVTDANAANRVAKFTIDDGTNILWVLANDVAQVASTTCDWNAFPGGSMEAAPGTGATARVYSMPEILLQPGWRISTSTTNKQAGDIWSAIVATIEEVVGRPD